jgi:hypothetical protein
LNVTAPSGKDDLPSLEISTTPFSKGDRIRTKATNFDLDAEEDGEPFSVTHAAQGNGIWVNGTIKHVFSNKGPQGMEQTYKALFDGDKVTTKTWHSDIEAEPAESSSSESTNDDDSTTLKDLGVASESDEGDKTRRTSSRTTIGKPKPVYSPQKITRKTGAKTAKTTKLPAATKKKPKPNPPKRSAPTKEPPGVPLHEENINGIVLIFVYALAIVLFCNCNLKLQL